MVKNKERFGCLVASPKMARLVKVVNIDVGPPIV